MKPYRLEVGGVSVNAALAILLIWGANPYFLTALFMV